MNGIQNKVLSNKAVLCLPTILYRLALFEKTTSNNLARLYFFESPMVVLVNPTRPKQMILSFKFKATISIAKAGFFIGSLGK